MLLLVKGCSYIMTERVQFDSGNQTQKSGKEKKKKKHLPFWPVRKEGLVSKANEISLFSSVVQLEAGKRGEQRAVMVLIQQHTSKNTRIRLDCQLKNILDVHGDKLQ